MAKQGQGKSRKQFKNEKRNRAVTFDPEERRQHLKNMIGSKKRRREFYHKKMEKEEKEQKRQDRSDHKNHRRDELRKAKELL